ncbi:MAG: PQQ-dependent sugar dehydrogenase [Verrucomicrobiaceae bacterium]|nr:PQQ-dependent sugar dehydrogenase [Verrucomicrobiaceae bacterium]
MRLAPRRLLLALVFYTGASSAQQARVKGLTITGSPDLGRALLSQPAYEKQVFRDLLDIVSLPDRKGWLMVERRGQIWQMPVDEATGSRSLVLDVAALHPGTENVYSVQLHPRYRENGVVFVTYTKGANVEDGSTLSRFRAVETPEGLRFDQGSEEVLLHWRSGGHNGAAMQFGPDGYLYLTTGDSEVPSPPDPLNTGQDLDDLLSCVLRIDVDQSQGARPYLVPSDNPFVKTPGARPEIWAIGFRNPWKIAFDHATGRLWCGDVGWEQWEMVHLVTKGGNYGWSATEAGQPIKPETTAAIPITAPVVAHPHSEAASITGGFVYRGKDFPELIGAYIYGDYETGKVWAVWHDGQHVVRHEEVCDTPHKIVTFGEGPDFELIYAHYAGESTLHRFVRNPQAGKPTAFPRKLSETGLFSAAADHRLAEGVITYDIKAAMWEDGASATRFIALPEGAPSIDTKVSTNKQGKITAKNTWPKDAVVGRTVSIAEQGTTRRIETQILHFDGSSWQGYSYRWAEDGRDAELVGPSGDWARTTLSSKPDSGRSLPIERRLHSRAECMRCHTMWTGYVNGFQPQQIVKPEPLIDLGIIQRSYLDQSKARLVNPHDKTEPLEARARSWLHTNCSHCHREHGGGSVAVFLNAELDTEGTRLVNQLPQRGSLGVDNARLIANGSPGHSVLLHRLALIGAGHMPMVGSREPDADSIALLSDWIRGLPVPASVPSFPKEVAALTEARVSQWVALARADNGDLEESFQVLIGDSAANAMALIAYLDSPDADPAIKANSIKLGVRSPNGNVRALFARYLTPDKREKTLPLDVDATELVDISGDASRGGLLFAPDGKAATCLACHLVAGAGRDVGPDLSHVASRLSPIQLLESILKPSKEMASDFTPTVITLRSGEQLIGFVRDTGTTTTSLKQVTGQTMRIEVKDIVDQKASPVSVMPEGLHQAFTVQEMADLQAYLRSLR